ncbi:MAG: cation:proton antiporter, partial [Planctomycetota bacterium]
MHEFDLLAYAAALLAYGLLSERLSAWLVSAPMFFMLVGLVVGPAVSAICDVSLDDGVVAFVAEVTLALLLFTEAATIDVRSLFAEKAAPARMLVLGLPIAIVLGGVAGYFVLPELGLWPALLLAALLAPTDAALGAAVVESEHVPESTRRAIGVESGLNDGLALPAVLALAGL